jgi:glycosyltransferase involved in cell wall biosynthesis
LPGRKRQQTPDGPLRVLHLRATPFLGSPERLLLGRARVLDRSECTYLVGIFDEAPTGENPFYRHLIDSGVDAFLLEDPISASGRNIASIMKKVRAFRPHIICSHDFKSNVHALLAGKITGVPLVQIFHGRTRPRLKGRIFHLFDDLLLKRFDAVGCVSSRTETLVRKMAPKVMTHLVVNAVDVDDTIRLSRFPLDGSELKGRFTKRVAFAGRLNPEKGLPFLIDAADRIVKSDPEVQFLIIGDGPERGRIEQMVRERGLSGTVLFLGFRANVFPWFAAADIVVLPSLTEGMPVVVLEAFALGKPVVAAAVGGVPEIIEDGVTGLLVPSQDSVALAQSLSKLLADSAKAAAMGARGQAYVREHHSFISNRNAYLAMYHAVLARMRNGSSSTSRSRYACQ